MSKNLVEPNLTKFEISKAKPNASMASAGENFKIPSENQPFQ